MSALCGVCGKLVRKEDQEDHLKDNHLGPHYFWWDATPYRTMKPSMLLRQLKELMKASPMNFTYLQADGGDKPIRDDDTIDLTRMPHFYSVPPGTMWG